MGRPMPGYEVVLLDPVSGEPARGGRDLPGAGPAAARADGRLPRRRRAARRRRCAAGYYHTGDIGAATPTATSPTSGAPTTCSRPPTTGSRRSSWRACCSSTRPSPRRRSCPSPDPMRLAVPKAYVVLAAGWAPTARPPGAIFAYCREQLAPFKRVRRLEFARAAQDDLRQDPAGRAARSARRRRPARHRVPRGGLPMTSYAVLRAAAPSTPLLGDTIGANLDSAVAALRRPGGAGRLPERAAVDVRGVRRRGGRAGARPARAGVGEGRPGRDLGAELPGVGARAVRHRQDRRDHGQHQSGVPAARARVRAQPVGRAASGVRYAATAPATIEGWSRRSGGKCPALRAVVYIGDPTWDELVGRPPRWCRPDAGRVGRPRCPATTRSTSSTPRARPASRRARRCRTTTSSTTATSSGS